jgi:hypothetical protein
MKGISNGIRIGMVRRPDVPSKLNKELSSTNLQEQTNHQPVTEQVCE